MSRRTLDQLQALARAGGPEAREARHELLLRASGQRGGRSSGRKRRGDPEGEAQRTYLALLEMEMPLVYAYTFSVPLERVSKGMTGRLKALGARPGIMDLLCILPPPSGLWVGMALEFKAEGREREREGGRSPAQVEWAEKFIAARWFYRVVYTADQGMEAARECYGGGG